MVTYVDTSTLLKLIIEEDGSERAGIIWRSADAVAAASLIVVEAHAALSAAERGDRLTARQHRSAKTGLNVLLDDLHIVAMTDQLVVEAAYLAELDGLRGYDAIHLAAALSIGATVLTSADTGLCAAAARHGLHTANPTAI